MRAEGKETGGQLTKPLLLTALMFTFMNLMLKVKLLPTDTPLTYGEESVSTGLPNG